MSDWTYVGNIKLLQVQLYEMTGKGQYDVRGLIAAERLVS